MSKNLAEKANLSKPIILWNRTISRAISHSKAIGNAIVAETLLEAVSRSDIIWSCLSDEEAVISSFDAILETSICGKLFLECSTITPEATNKLAARVLNAGAEFVAMPGMNLYSFFCMREWKDPLFPLSLVLIIVNS